MSKDGKNVELHVREEENPCLNLEDLKEINYKIIAGGEGVILTNRFFKKSDDEVKKWMDKKYNTFMKKFI